MTKTKYVFVCFDDFGTLLGVFGTRRKATNAFKKWWPYKSSLPKHEELEPDIRKLKVR